MIGGGLPGDTVPGFIISEVKRNHNGALVLCLWIFLTGSDPASRSQIGDVGTPRQTSNVRVPFVGCKSDGQVGPLEAPAGRTEIVRTSTRAAQRLAYYKARYGFGVLAPRDWHCFSTYGSSGSSLYVSPEPIDPARLFSATWKGFSGQVIQISVSDAGTSGRFQVAKIIARVFPDYRQFVRDVIAEGAEPASSFPIGPYPHDKLTYRSKRIVEFETPADVKGLGTDSRLQGDTDPISGVAILFGDDTSLVQLSTRLPVQDRELTRVIVEQVEREVAHSKAQ
jgi:hypothetical protein